MQLLTAVGSATLSIAVGAVIVVGGPSVAYPLLAAMAALAIGVTAIDRARKWAQVESQASARLALLALAGATVLVTMNGVRLASEVTLADLLFFCAAIFLVPGLVVGRLGTRIVPWWILAGTTAVATAGLLSAALSSARSDNLEATAKFLLAFGLLPVLFAFTATTRGRIRALARLWLMSATINAGVAVADAIGWTSIGPDVSGKAFIGRVAGLTVQPNHLAVAGAMALPVAVSFALAAKSARHFVLYFGLAGILSTAIMASGSRAGLIGACAGLCALFLVHSHRRLHLLALGAAAALAAIAVNAATQVGTSDLFAALHRAFGADPAVGGSDMARRLYYKAALADFESHPLTGIGLGAVREAHDIYLQLLQAGGLLGLTGFLTVVIGAIAASSSRMRHGRFASADRHLAGALCCAVIVWLVAGFAQNQIYDRFLYVPIGLIAALLLVEDSQTSDTAGSPTARGERATG